MSKTYHGKDAFLPQVHWASFSRINITRFFKVVFFEILGLISISLTVLLGIILAQTFLLPVVMIATASIACTIVISLTLFFLPQLKQSKPVLDKNKELILE